MGFFNPRYSNPMAINTIPSKKRTPENRRNAYGDPSAPGMPSTFIPKRLVMMERTRPHPPKTPKLCVTARLLS